MFSQEAREQGNKRNLQYFPRVLNGRVGGLVNDGRRSSLA